ncbi:MAG TPA: Gfo/Idh/MocA family oxidoreductase [Acidimicrobiales bacterium]|nr:Gfo/Idh/MocA family oxidoreductase [Acidimicrobiales bacterium]
MTIRVGLLGCGFIGLTHAVSLAALIEAGVVDAEVAAVCDVDEARARGLADLVGTRTVPTPQELVDASDAVWVCTPTSSHLDLVRAVAEAGRAVFCEKPLGRNLDEARKVVGVVTQAGVPNQVGLVLRHAPVFRILRELAQGGGLGRLMTIVFRDDQFLPVQGQYASTWRGDVAVAGGGTLIEHSIHDLDVLSWLAGPARRITAHTASLAGLPGIDDVATVLLELDGGRTAVLDSVWHQVLSRPSTRRVEVFGQDAAAWLDDDWVGPLHVQTSEGVSAVECPHPEWTADLRLSRSYRDALCVYGAANRTFLESIASGQPAEPGVGIALTAHELVDAAYRSAQEGGTIVLSDA